MDQANQKKKKGRQYLLGILIGMALGVAVSFAFGLGKAANITQACQYVSDGFFVVAVFYGGIGALVVISTTGIFDVFSYGFKTLLMMFTFGRKKETPSFYDYKLEKAEKRGATRWEMALGGLACLVIAILAWVGYYRL